MTDFAQRLPDWIIIGAMKAATSSLHRYLAQNPMITASNPKELDFFLEPKFSKRGLDWYGRQFGSPNDAQVAGESSPNYTKCHEHPGVAARIHEHLPDVKLIYVLRDPLRRIESHWIHAVGAGRWRGTFDEAVRDVESSRMVQTSRYWTQLSQYLEYFDPAQIKVISYEALSRDPQTAVSEVLEFLGLDPSFEHEFIGQRVHSRVNKMRPSRLGLRLRKETRSRWTKYLGRIVASPIESPVWEPATRKRVMEYLRPEAERIRVFSGLDFADWSI